MNILILQKDLFHFVGGGETVYGTIISCNPEIEFYYFCDEEPIDFPRPQNAHPINLPQRDDIISIFRAADFIRNESCHTIYFERTIKNFLDFLCSSLPDVVFDIVDIPDYALVGDLIRGSLETSRVKYKKIVVSLHGTQSASLETGWVSNEALNLRDFEKRQCLAADAVYGISERYIHERLGVAPVPSYCLDPFVFVRETRKKYVKKFDFPQIACVGRKIRRKGADLFVELLRWVSPDCYSNAVIIGPDHHAGDGLYGDDYIQKCASNRNVTVQCSETYSHNQLEELFSQNTLLVLPVRNETFNLVALEALFSGCPVAISDGAGVCDYLDRYYPEIPYIKIKLDNFYECIKEIEFVLEHYDTYRAQLAESLQKVRSRQTGSSIHKIYEEILQLPQRTGITQGKLSYIAGAAHANTVVTTFSNADVAAFIETYSSMSENSYAAVEEKISALEKIRSQYNESCSGISFVENGLPITPFPCNFYLEFGRLYNLIDHTRIALMYDLRVARLLGAHPKFSDGLLLDRVRYSENKLTYDSVKSIFENKTGESEMFPFSADYISRLLHLPDNYEPYEELSRSFCSQEPLISVIISVYNAEHQLGVCLQKLNMQTLAKQKKLQVIIVDSHSPQNEKAVVNAFMHKTNLNIVYARTKERETIQKAWNRGITLSSAKYITALGTDETYFPDGLERLLSFIEEGNFDWVMANSLLSAVDSNGLFQRDIGLYDYSNADQKKVLHDKRYLRWCGGLYRKDLHDRFGFYDDSYKIAGCTEFAFRILPYIKVGYLSETLASYTNFPSPRASQPESTELEYYRVSFFLRTSSSISAMWRDRSTSEILSQISVCMGFRRCTCSHISTDIQYAMHLSSVLMTKDSFYSELFDALLEIFRNYQKILYSEEGIPDVVSCKRTIQAVKVRVDHLFSVVRKFLDVENNMCIFNDWMFERYTNIVTPSSVFTDLNILR